MSSNRNFGIVFFIFFLIIALLPLKNNEDIRLWALIISLSFFILGILNSKLLTPLNFLWHKFGVFLGNIVSNIVLALLFFGLVTPIGLIMKIIKKDILHVKFDNNLNSYWFKRKEKINTMKNQF